MGKQPPRRKRRGIKASARISGLLITHQESQIN